MTDFDTIAAIATPIGEGGVGIVRISGPGALEAGLKVFAFGAASGNGGPFTPRPRVLYRGTVADTDSAAAAAIDGALFVYMKGPSSYTGEDVVELQMHGSPVALKRGLEAVFKRGVRPAGPGEFTRRAFLNGKMDLIEAEAVLDVIRARTDAALKCAEARLEGALSARVSGIKETLVGASAAIDAELEFPDEDAGAEAEGKGAAAPLVRAAGELRRLLSTFDEGAALRDGVKVLILGRPNAGKSSLLNALLGRERAIVTPIPGTTRDVIEEAVNLGGYPFILMDTAGLRDGAGFIESVGVRLAVERIASAGVVLFVVDASSTDGLGEDLELLEDAVLRRGKRYIVVANKVDAASKEALSTARGVLAAHRTVYISALKGEGLDALSEALKGECAGRSVGGDADQGVLVASARQKAALQGCLESVERAAGLLSDGRARDAAASELRLALTRLGELTGEVTTDDVLDRIFGEFCVGK